MKLTSILVALGFLLALFSFSSAQVPQLINYQGKLTKSSGAPLDTTIQMVFTIYADSSGINSKWSETQGAVKVEKGVFNVLLGGVNAISDSVFDGTIRYLGVKVGGDPEITPRKAMVSVPYAYRAGSGGDGSDSKWTFRITDTADTSITTGGNWGIARRGATLFGDMDSTHVNLGVACTTGLSGGYNLKYCTVGGGMGNTAKGDNATVGGGYSNMAYGHSATVGGGSGNMADSDDATIGGGILNTARYGATVPGGYANAAEGPYSFVGGGRENAAADWYATIPGGLGDTVAGLYSFAAGAYVRLTSTADYTLAFGNNFTTSASHAVIFHDTEIPIKVGIGTTSPTERLDVAGTTQMTGFKMPTGASIGYVLTSDASGVGTWQAVGGTDKDWAFRVTDTADTTLTTQGAWGIARYGNVLYGNKDSTHVNLGVACTTGTDGYDFSHSTVGGGLGNTASGGYAAIGGGWRNTASNGGATVGGGYFNIASGPSATISGGWSNMVSGADAAIGGGESNTASALWATAGGGHSNTASDTSATVAGGDGNTASNDWAMVGGGLGNTASGSAATVSGGDHNIASGYHATVGGGYEDTASGSYATVSGGQYNKATNNYATVPGGYGNVASGSYAIVGGGSANWVDGYCATVPGGFANVVAGDYSFATGSVVTVTSDAHHTFAFGYDFTTSTPHAVIFHDTNTPIKVGIGTTSPTTTLHVQGDGLVKSTGGSVSLSGSDGAMEIWGTDGAFIDLKDYESDDFDFRITQVGGTTNLGLLGGNVGIGTTSPTEKLDVYGTARVRGMSEGTGTDVVVDANGVLLRKSSSIRYKQNIRELDSTPDQIFQLNPVRFNWKTTGEEDVGLIAEEVEKIVPDLVIYDKEGKPDAVKYDKMAIYLLELVKTQQEKMDAQQEQIDALRIKLEKLEYKR